MNLSKDTISALEKRQKSLSAQIEAFGSTPADIRILDDLTAKIQTARGGEKPAVTKPASPGVDIEL